jgi:hypothetical protein
MSTHNSAEGSTFEVQAPGGQRAVNFILTGDETLGYWSSVSPPTAWMSTILDVIGDRQLRYICMPGSHDAGMSVINGDTLLVESSNVITQRFSESLNPDSLPVSLSRSRISHFHFFFALGTGDSYWFVTVPNSAMLILYADIGQQLLKGSRYFDVRPVIGDGGQFLTGHYSAPSSPVLGANGEYLSDIVDEVNK